MTGELGVCWHLRKRYSKHLRIQVTSSTSLKMQDTQGTLRVALFIFPLLEIPIFFGRNEQMCLTN